MDAGQPGRKTDLQRLRHGNEVRDAGHATIKCIDANISGEWRGGKTATVEIEFQGCQNPQEQPCQTAQTKSEIKTLPLEGELGFIKNQVKEGKLVITVGLDLKPQAPLTELATYECGGGRRN